MLGNFFRALRNLTRAADDFAGTLDDGNALLRQGLGLDAAEAELRMIEAPAPVTTPDPAPQQTRPVKMNGKRG